MSTAPVNRTAEFISRPLGDNVSFRSNAELTKIDAHGFLRASAIFTHGLYRVYLYIFYFQFSDLERCIVRACHIEGSHRSKTQDTSCKLSILYDNRWCCSTVYIYRNYMYNYHEYAYNLSLDHEYENLNVKSVGNERRPIIRPRRSQCKKRRCREWSHTYTSTKAR